VTCLRVDRAYKAYYYTRIYVYLRYLYNVIDCKNDTKILHAADVRSVAYKGGGRRTANHYYYYYYYYYYYPIVRVSRRQITRVSRVCNNRPILNIYVRVCIIIVRRPGWALRRAFPRPFCHAMNSIRRISFLLLLLLHVSLLLLSSPVVVHYPAYVRQYIYIYIYIDNIRVVCP